MKEIMIAGHCIRVNSTPEEAEEADEDYPVPRLPEDGLSFNDLKTSLTTYFLWTQ